MNNNLSFVGTNHNRDQQVVRDLSPPRMLFGGKHLDTRLVASGFVFLLALLVSLAIIISPAQIPTWNIIQNKPETLKKPSQSNAAIENQLNRLQEITQQELEPDTIIQSVYLDRLPELSGDSRDRSGRKKIFLNTLLPAALVALEEVDLERKILMAIIDKIGRRPADLVFSDEKRELRQNPWQLALTEEESEFIARLIQKYRTDRAELLLARVDTVPVSLLLAQGAIESSWGRSRFAREGNNIFGILTWGEKGLVPNDRGEGKTHKMMNYDNVLDSVRDYLLTINCQDAYKPLRRIRQQTTDVMLLVEGLENYSVRKNEYIEDVKEMIRHNRLQEYDRSINTFMKRAAVVDLSHGIL